MPNVARVNCAVVTNIGVAHIEQLGSKENILKEKLHIQDGMSEDGTLFLNGDDPLLRNVIPENGRKKILYGLSEGCDYRERICIWKMVILYLQLFMGMKKYSFILRSWVSIWYRMPWRPWQWQVNTVFLWEKASRALRCLRL